MEQRILDRIHSAKLISKYILENLDENEQKALENWLNTDPSHRKQFELACEISSRAKYENPLADEKEWKEFARKYKLGHSVPRLRAFLKYAVLLCLCLSGALLYYRYQAINTSERPVIAAIPDSTQAILTLANGEIVRLNSTAETTIQADSCNEIISQQNRLVYRQTGSGNTSIPQYNTIYVPRYGEYTLQLADGTCIKLNAETTLKYLVSFSENSREVWLSGEGYFQVSRREDSPFIVHLRQGSVNVLGTTFNISSYPSVPEIRTTLISGSVRFDNGTQSRILKPGMQAIVHEGTEHIEIEEIDVNTAIAWTKGQFYFKEETLENILTTLSRWYDIDFIYQNEQAKKLYFTVETDRFKDISDILTLIAETGRVRFKQDDKTIIVQ